MSNPLLDLHTDLPLFSQIRPEHVRAAIDQVLADNRRRLDELARQTAPPTWDNFVRPLEDLSDRMDRAWGPVVHLSSVADSEALRQVYNECQPLVSDYHTELDQNQAIYRGFKAIADGPEYPGLHPAQRKAIDNRLRDFHLAGIDLPAPQQARYKQIQQALTQLATRFSENLLDATHAWKKHLTDPADLAGVPATVQALLRQRAEEAGLEGWLLTLDAPCYLPVMQYADDRALRQELYRAYFTRASELGSQPERWKNGPLIEELLRLRQELAHLLGFPNYAEYSLATKMAHDPPHVLNFLNDLARRSQPVAVQELAELRDFARVHHHLEILEIWDVPYYSEKLRHHRYELSQEQLRPYFPLPQVLDGLFEVARRLYGIRFTALETTEIWHPEVRLFEIHDEAGALRGRLYLDPYARKGKRGGAWMGELLNRRGYPDQSQTPLAYTVCNFPPPVGGRPALLTHAEVTTLFHEFGHAMHHLLTQVDYLSVGGINGVPWDAVELPSQIMENWCWEREALDLFARHEQTGEALPETMLHKMLAAKNFQAGLFMVRQLEFALFDFRLHMEYRADGPADQVQRLLDQVRAQVAALHPPEFNRFQHSFGHIFSGGYAAGYYSYKWAEVLSADAFSRFEDNGIFDPASGRAFLHTFLEHGGSRDPMELFVEFRGREPNIDALLRHNGMAA